MKLRKPSLDVGHLDLVEVAGLGLLLAVAHVGSVVGLLAVVGVVAVVGLLAVVGVLAVVLVLPVVVVAGRVGLLLLCGFCNVKLANGVWWLSFSELSLIPLAQPLNTHLLNGF